MDVMEFGELVEALRKEHVDDDGSGSRCPWTPRMLGEKSGLGVEAIENIESGEHRHLLPVELTNLARALNLTSRERREFFFISSGIADEDAARNQSDAEAVLSSQLAIMREIRLPCFLIDVFSNIVAANGGIAELFGIGPETLRAASAQPAGFNLLRVIFDKEQLSFRTIVGPDWMTYARHNLQYSRVLSLRYRHTKKFQDIYRELLKLPDFDTFWRKACQDEVDHYSTSWRYEYNHPRFGSLSYYTASSVTLTGHGELSLAVYLPAKTRTAEIFAQLVRDRDLVQCLAHWPN
jgi:hypothetical protein